MVVTGEHLPWTLSSNDLMPRAIELTHAWFEHDARSRQFFVTVAALSLAFFCALLWLWYSTRLRRLRRRTDAAIEKHRASEHQARETIITLQERLSATTAAVKHHETIARELNTELATWRADAQKIELTRKELLALRDRLTALSQDIEKEKEECKREHERNRTARDSVWTEAQALRSKEMESQNRANEARAMRQEIEQRAAETARQQEAVVNERARLNHLEIQLEDELVALERRDERIAAREEALELRRQTVEAREAAVPAKERIAAETSRRVAEESRLLAEQRADLARTRWQLRMEQAALEDARREVDSHRAALAALADLYDAKREQVELWHRLISRQEGLAALAALRPHE